MLLIIRQVELIEKKKFAAAPVNSEQKIFVVYITALNVNLGDNVHFLKKAQIAYLKVDKVFTKIFSEYADFVNVFLLKLAIELLKHIKNQQSCYQSSG